MTSRMKQKSLESRLMELHRHLGCERGKMTVLYGESTLLEVSLLLAEAAKAIRSLKRQVIAK